MRVATPFSDNIIMVSSPQRQAGARRRFRACVIQMDASEYTSPVACRLRPIYIRADNPNIGRANSYRAYKHAFSESSRGPDILAVEIKQKCKPVFLVGIVIPQPPAQITPW